MRILPPQVVVVSQRPLVRELLAELLRSQCGASSVARFATLEDAEPALHTARLLICDSQGLAPDLLAAFAAGVAPQLPRLRVLRVDDSTSSEELVSSVRAPQDETRANRAELTPHEAAVLLAVAAGLRNADIARRMRRSAKTVEKHRANLQRKLGLRTVAQLTAYAIHNGLVSVDSILAQRRG